MSRYSHIREIEHYINRLRDLWYKDNIWPTTSVWDSQRIDKVEFSSTSIRNNFCISWTQLLKESDVFRSDYDRQLYYEEIKSHIEPRAKIAHYGEMRLVASDDFLIEERYCPISHQKYKVVVRKGGYFTEYTYE